MSKDPDDDALSWGDESDPTHIDAPAPAKPATPTRERPPRRPRRTGEPAAASTETRTDATPDNDAIVGVDADLAPDPADAEAAHNDDDLPAVTSSAVLLSVGILAGAYILYTVGWFITFQRASSTFIISDFDTVMSRARGVLAIVAPAFWFAATLLLTRRRRPITRLLWLLAGIVVLAPLPFILGN